ncbi:alpha/beta hydrolase family protein [Catellatospora citrea]|uniref:Lipase n=1 Tax=Catellatospora citrea TaxID=53366 RepID=A0A8J3KTQ7_9ACTN|nr:alpha/beta hydrolase [Catellatospora citrea]RKE11382.1 cutinase [Catellatospora citrea]GIG03264.1 lipase [Catellatospora citrea]
MQQSVSSPRRRLTRLIATTFVATALAAGTALGTGAPAYADEIGQAPTSSNITGNGSFSVSTYNISSLVSGFGGGVAYYPSTAGRYPVVAVSPGFTARWSSISWIGPRLASWGFVVVGIETNSVYDQPASRGSQLLAALNWAVNSAPSAITSRADGSRRGVAGHSMGGGGTLEALAADTTGNVKAGVPLAPWNSDKTWNNVNEPVQIIGGESDTVAGVSSHSIPFYNSLGGSKSYVELNGASHFFPQTTNATTSRALVSWFKRWLNQDARFTPFTCGYSGTAISDFRTNAC